MREFDRLTNHEKQTRIAGAERFNEIVSERHPRATNSGLVGIFRRSLERLGILPEVLHKGTMNIDSKIANLELCMQTPLFWELGLVETFERELNLFVKLRDQYAVVTVDQALNLFRQRRLNPKIIRSWIEEDLFRGSSIVTSVLMGYPEFWNLLND